MIKVLKEKKKNQLRIIYLMRIPFKNLEEKFLDK